MHLSSIQLACAALVALALGAAAPLSTSHHVARRSFLDAGCLGIYDAEMFARLEKVCLDCCNHFKEPQQYTQCRANCFTAEDFPACVDLLFEEDNLELYKNYIRVLHGAAPGV